MRRRHVGLAISSSSRPGQVQLYFRDPAGNLIELNWPDATTLDRSQYPQLRRLADAPAAVGRRRSAPSSTSSPRR